MAFYGEIGWFKELPEEILDYDAITDLNHGIVPELAVSQEIEDEQGEDYSSFTM